MVIIIMIMKCPKYRYKKSERTAVYIFFLMYSIFMEMIAMDGESSYIRIQWGCDHHASEFGCGIR